MRTGTYELMYAHTYMLRYLPAHPADCMSNMAANQWQRHACARVMLKALPHLLFIVRLAALCLHALTYFVSF